MSYVLLALVIIVAVLLLNAISAFRGAIDDRFDSLDEKLEKLQQLVDELDYRTLTSAEKAYRHYEKAHHLTLSDIEQMKEDETVHLISCSYIYPSKEPEMLTFDYKHGSLGKQTSVGGKAYVSVNGSWQLGREMKWRPYTFYAATDECATSSFEGRIRRL